MSETESHYKKIRLGPRTVEIPKHWEKTQLGDLGTYLNGYGFKSSDWGEEGRPIIRIQNLTNSAGEETNYYDGDIKDRYVINQGDLLVSWSATLGVFIWDGPEALLNQHIFKVEPGDNVNDDFLYYLLDHNLDLLKMRVQGTTMKHIRKSTFEDTFVPLPPLAEQQRIADILSTVDEQIQQTDKIINETQNLKKGLVKELLTHGISNGEYKTAHFGPLGVDIPVEWELSPIKEVTKQITDGVHTTPDYVDDGIPFLSTKNINPFRSEFDTSSYEKYISKESHKQLVKKAQPEKGDIIIARRATIGPAQLVRTESEFSIFVGLGLIKLTQEIDGRFLEQFFNWNKIQEILNLKSPGSTMKTLNLETLRNQIIPIPPLNEQRKIADILFSVDEKIHQEQNTKQDLQKLKRGLMQDLLTGRERVYPEQA